MLGQELSALGLYPHLGLDTAPPAYFSAYGRTLTEHSLDLTHVLPRGKAYRGRTDAVIVTTAAERRSCLIEDEHCAGLFTLLRRMIAESRSLFSILVVPGCGVLFSRQEPLLLHV